MCQDIFFFQYNGWNKKYKVFVWQQILPICRKIGLHDCGDFFAGEYRGILNAENPK